MTDTALYRYYDEADRPLYIGITDNLDGRERGHFRSSCWMPFVGRSAVERYPYRDDALEAEQKAIGAERPLFNRQHNNTAAARDRQKAYLKEIGRMDLYTKWCLWQMPLGELEMRRRARKKKLSAPEPEEDYVFRGEQPNRDQVTLITNAAFQDQRLSWRARGLLAFVMTLPPADRFTGEWLTEQAPEGRDDTLSALAELAVCGYYRDGVISDAKPTEGVGLPVILLPSRAVS